MWEHTTTVKIRGKAAEPRILPQMFVPRVKQKNPNKKKGGSTTQPFFEQEIIIIIRVYYMTRNEVHVTCTSLVAEKNEEFAN